MAALLLLALLLASGGAASGDDTTSACLPHLDLLGIPDQGREHASDAPPQGLTVTDYLNSTHGCGSFAALVARTENVREIFQEHVVAGDGLTVFCPDDPAVAAFEHKFNNLSADDQVAVLLHHGAAARYGREQISAFEWVAVRTLAADAATSNRSLVLTVRDDGDTVSLFHPHGGAAARVTKEIPSDDSSTLAVYVVDAVLLPSHLLRQLLGSGDEAAACTACGGYLWWLHIKITVWQGLLLTVATMVSIASGILLAEHH